jgi:hypothetical protein
LIFSVIFNISSPSASLYGVSGTGTRNSYIFHNGLVIPLIYVSDHHCKPLSLSLIFRCCHCKHLSLSHIQVLPL